MENAELIIVRGGGDLATGVVQKLYRCGLPVLILETEKPTAIRRSVALCEAVYDGTAQVEDMTCRRIEQADESASCHGLGEIPLMVDPEGRMIEILKPVAVIDAILAKRNLGTNRDMAPITIALGPGFEAGTDVDAVIETMRGHDLGRLILKGAALPNTGTPGEIGGKSADRVLKAPGDGAAVLKKGIGDIVGQGETVLCVGDTPICAPFSGLIRGLIREGHEVQKGFKIGDIDPRTDVDWKTISDKARCLGGAALEAYYYIKRMKRL